MKVKNHKHVPLLHCVTVDCFAAPCFVVEDKHGLLEDMGNNTRLLLNGVTLVKPRDEACPAEFLQANKVTIADIIISSSK